MAVRVLQSVLNQLNGMETARAEQDRRTRSFGWPRGSQCRLGQDNLKRGTIQRANPGRLFLGAYR